MRVWWVVGAIGRALGIAVFAGVALVAVGLGVVGVMDSQEPTYWGTFTETDCIDARRGCRSVGYWVSDDGSIRMSDIYLDGQPGPDGTVRARYRPTGINHDKDNNIVHTSVGVALEPVLPWVLALGCAGAGAYYAWTWWGRPRGK